MEDPFNLPPDILGRIPLFAELQKVLSWQGGPVNWDLAKQVGVSVVASWNARDDVTDADRLEVREAVRAAELWLIEEAHMTEAAHLAEPVALTPVAWAELATTWLQEIVDPVAAKVTRAMGQQSGALGDAGDAGMLTQALGQMAPLFSGLQTGAIIGALAQEITGTFELGFPPAEDEPVAIIPPSVDRVADAYGLDARLARLWVALRASAHRLAFEGPWVRTHFFSLYLDFVSTLEIDFASGIQRLQSLDISDPEALQEALGQESLFETRLSDAAQRAGARIDSFLAVIEAYSVAAAEAASARAGGLGAVVEAFARRAAEDDGRGTKLLTGFIGLNPHERRPVARRFIRTSLERGGWDLLNKLWAEPDAFPSEQELDDPDTWSRRFL